MKSEINNVMPINLPPKQDAKKEHFEQLVFHRDGSVGIQTSDNMYFMATAHFFAAQALANLLHDKDHLLAGGIPENRLSTNQETEGKICIRLEKLLEAVDADDVTSNWPGVVRFMLIFKPLYRNAGI